MNEKSKQYKWHVANLREIQIAIDNVAQITRNAIKQKNSQNLRSSIRLYSFLIGTWAECRLKKLLFENSGFTESEINKIINRGSSTRTQFDQWKKVIELAFRKHYCLPKGKLEKSTLGVRPYYEMHELLELLENDLRIIVEIRNKLAHGQWIYPLNNHGTKVDNEKYKLINQENFLSLQFKYSLLGHMANLIHDLVVSQTTFERDFEKHFKKIYQTKQNLLKRSYDSYQNNLINNYQKGKEKRHFNPKS